MLRPTLLLGLGEIGARVAIRLADTTVARGPACAAVVGTLALTHSGLRAHGRAAASPQEGDSPVAPPPPAISREGDAAPGAVKSAVPPAEGMDAETATGPEGPDETSTPTPTSAEAPDEPAESAAADVPFALAEALAPEDGVLAANRAALDAKREEIAKVLLREVGRIRDHAATITIERAGTAVGDPLVILIFAPLSDGVASTALPVCLEVVDHLARGALFGLSHEIHLTLFAPDLLSPTPSKVEHARAYAALQELEALLGGADAQPIQVDGTWLFSRRSAADRFVADEATLVPVLEEHVWRLINGAPEVESAGGPSTHQSVGGKRTRYSTFGYSRLRFPRDELVEAAASLVVAGELRDLPWLAATRFPTESVYSDVADFVEEHRVAELPELLATSHEGVPLRPPFHLPAPGRKDASFLEHLDAVAGAYRRIENNARRAVAERNQALSDGMRAALREALQAVLRTPSRGTLGALDAWLAAAVQDDSNYLAGQLSQESQNLRFVLNALEERAEVVLFEGRDGRSERVQAYLKEDEEAPRGRRKLLGRVEQDIREMTRLLHEHRDRMEGLRTELDAARTAAASRDAPTAFEELRQASLEQQLRTAEEGVRACFARLGQLQPVLEDLRAEVAELDRAIQDPTVRWNLLEAQEARFAAEEREARSAYKTLEEEVDDARVTLHDQRVRLLIWAVLAVGVTLAASFAAYRWIPDERIAASASFLVALGAFGLVCKHAGAPFLNARKKVVKLARQLRDKQEELVGLYRELADNRFRHVCFTHVLDWCRWLPDHVRALLRSTREVAERLRGAAAGEAARAAGWKPASDTFSELLEPTGGIEALVRQREDVIRSRMADVWRDRPFEDALPRLLDDAATVEEILAALREQAHGCFADLRKKTADEFFADQTPGENERRRTVSRLYRSAAPLAKPADVIRHGAAFEQAYAALTSEPSAVKNVMLSLGYPSVTHRSASDQEITVSRVACGFAAFQLSVVSEGRHHLRGLAPDLRRNLYVDPDQHEQLPDLFPTDVIEIME